MYGDVVMRFISGSFEVRRLPGVLISSRLCNFHHLFLSMLFATSDLLLLLVISSCCSMLAPTRLTVLDFSGSIFANI